MLKRFFVCICFSSLMLLEMLTLGCGGGSAPPSKPSCTGGPYNLVGGWDIQFLDGAVYWGVIDSAGLAIFFKPNPTNADPESGSELVIPSITGACSFSENLTYYTTRATVGSGAAYSFPITGTVQSDSGFSGTIQDGSPETFVSFSQPFTTTPLNTSMTVLDVDSPIGCPSQGCLQVQVVPSGTGNSADMTLSGADGVDCSLSGTLKQEGSNQQNLNVFDVSLTLTGTTCQVTGTITGLAFESPADFFNFVVYPPNGTFLYAMSANSADVFEMIPAGNPF